MTDERNETPKSIPELSEETRLLVATMRRVETGDVMTYDELRKIMSKDPQSDGRHYIASARRILLRDDGMVFGAVTGIGYRRLDDSGKLGAVNRRVAHVSRMARAGTKEVSSVDPDSLTKDQQMTYATLAVQLHIMARTASAKGNRAIAQLASGGRRPELSDALEAIRKTVNGDSGKED